MKHLKKLLFFIILSTTANLFSQVQFQKKYESTNASRAYSIKTTLDGGYIISGSYDVTGLLSAEFYSIKLDAQGDTLWANTYGYGVDTSLAVNRDGAGNEAYDIIQTHDSGYLIVGEAHDSSSGQSNALAIKLTKEGRMVWAKSYGGSLSDYGYSVTQLPDSGYILAGYTESHGLGIRDVYALRLNKIGDTIWTRAYGGNAIDGAINMSPTQDGGFILVGNTFSFGEGMSDVYVIKIEVNGDLDWAYAYGGPSNDFGNDIVQLSDKSYVISGSTESFGSGQRDVYVIKIDSLGELIWSKSMGGTGNESGKSVIELPNNQIAVFGNTRSFGKGFEDYYLIKMNGLGDTLLTKVYGGLSIDFGESIQSTANNGLIMTGFTNSFNTYNYDVYIVKTDSLGNSNCHQGVTSTTIVSPVTIKTITSTITSSAPGIKVATLRTGKTYTNSLNTCNINSINEMNIESQLVVYPNPTTNNITVQDKNGVLATDFSITILDIQGKQMRTQILTATNTSLDISMLKNGIYFAKIETTLGIATKKIIKY